MAKISEKEADRKPARIHPFHQLSPTDRHELLSAGVDFALYRLRRHARITTTELALLSALAGPPEVQ